MKKIISLITVLALVFTFGIQLTFAETLKDAGSYHLNAAIGQVATQTVKSLENLPIKAENKVSFSNIASVEDAGSYHLNAAKGQVATQTVKSLENLPIKAENEVSFSNIASGEVSAASSASISWPAYSGAAYYGVGILDVSAGDGVINVLGYTNGTSASVDGLISGRTYQFYILIYNSAGSLLGYYTSGQFVAQ